MVSFSSSAKCWYIFYSFISRGLACLYICTVYTEREVIYSTDSVLQIVVQDKNTSQMDFPDIFLFDFPDVNRVAERKSECNVNPQI